MADEQSTKPAPKTKPAASRKAPVKKPAAKKTLAKNTGAKKTGDKKVSDKAVLTTLGVGAAIGSAAIAAALLYTNFNRRKNEEPSAPQDAEPTD